MSINETNSGKFNQNAPKTAMGDAFEKATTNNQTQGQGNMNFKSSSNIPASGSFTFSDQSGIFSDQFTVVNDGLNKIASSMQAILENNIKSKSKLLDTHFIPLDHTSHDLGMDFLLVAVSQHGVKESVVGVYAWVLAKSTDTLGSETFTSPANGRQFTINAYPSQIFNAEYGDKLLVRDYLLKAAASYLDDKSILVYAGGCPIYTDLMDLDSEKDLTRILLNAMNACTIKAYDYKNITNGMIMDINLVEHDGSRETLEVERRLESGVSYDVHNNPIRADWRHTVYSRNRDNQGLRVGVNASTSKEVITITGYTDVVMVPQGTTRVDNPWSRTQMANSQNEQVFMPVNVITSLIPSKSQSLGNIIYALGVAIGSTWADYWYALQVLNPLNRPVDWPHSIAGLGYEASELFHSKNLLPLPTPADHISDPENNPPYSQDMWEATLGRYFVESTTFALEVPEGGATQWLYSDFVAAAFESNTVAQKPDSINAKILAYTNHLFNGKFEHVYREMGGNGRVVFTLPNRRFLMGRYHNNQQGNVRSLQDVDRLMLDNQVTVSKNKETLQFTRELVVAQSSPAISVQESIGMQQDIISSFLPHAEVNGYGYRLEIENVYAKALHQCILEHGPALINKNAVHNPNMSNMFATYIGDAMINTFGRSILTNNVQPRTGNYSGFFGNVRRV